MQALDRGLIASNLTRLRQFTGLTQNEVANKAKIGVATVSRLERGQPARIGTIHKICAALRTDLTTISQVQKFSNVVSKERPFVLHVGAERVWTKHFDKRRMAPLEDKARIQEAQERSRLASLGLVAMFQSTLNFVMPRGPQVILEEISGPTPYGPTINYRDYVLYCLRGEVLVRVGDGEFRLQEGDAMGYENGLNFIVEPLSKVEPSQRPPMVMRIGANRMGRKGKNP